MKPTFSNPYEAPTARDVSAFSADDRPNTVEYFIMLLACATAGTITFLVTCTVVTMSLIEITRRPAGAGQPDSWELFKVSSLIAVVVAFFVTNRIWRWYGPEIVSARKARQGHQNEPASNTQTNYGSIAIRKSQSTINEAPS